MIDKNEHDKLIAEVERLKQENKKFKRSDKNFSKLQKANAEYSEYFEKHKDLMLNSSRYIQQMSELKKQVEQLKEALKKCDTEKLTIIESINKPFILCPFCRYPHHSDDCEYIKLTK